MRHIIKGSEPAELVAWKAKANADWNPTSWCDLQNPEKSAVLRQLVQEQGSICCYCEDRIKGSGDSHIEHLESRSQYPERMFDYLNLLACCDFKIDREKEARHCGHARGNEPLRVHPLMPDCGEYFEFTSMGAITPRGEGERAQAATRTIQLLKLDLPRLEARRRAAIQGILDALDSGSEAELRALTKELDKPDPEGRLTPFCSALVGVLEKYLP